MAKKPAQPKKAPTAQQLHEREKKRFARSIIGVFEKAGFKRVPEVSDKEITFDGRTGDFDDVLVHENVLVFVEYTVSNPAGVKDHIKGKVHLFTRVVASPTQFITEMMEKFPTLKQSIPSSYHPAQLVVRILYCSKSEVSDEHKGLAKGTHFLWDATIRYFRGVTAAIKRSARYEILDFLNIPHPDVGVGGSVEQGLPAVKFSGSILPEVHSNFPSGFKVISFYVSPAAVLSRAFVLRKDGWRDSDGLYQRMISRQKIEKIRRHLRKNERVFVNNVILTLSDKTKLIGSDGKEVEPKDISKTMPISVELPQEGNSIGIVDGQHRVFSYYEGLEDDGKIAIYRNRQNLLATGIMYPAAFGKQDRERFEAGLFLEINSTQNTASSSLKQAIAVVVEPFSPDSVAKRVVQRLSAQGPLAGMLERFFFDTGVLKTTTMVSYGLRPLVRVEGDESMFHLWATPEQRQNVKEKKNLEDLESYTDFCAQEINKILLAARKSLGDKWKIKGKANPDGVLSVTFVNGILILLRLRIKKNGLPDQHTLDAALAKLPSFPFGTYKSSQYYALGEGLHKALFP